jgi:Holliday junction resolvasome RuvABC endonuclease subunit
MKTMGIDQSYNSTGIVILENGKMICAERFQSDNKKDRFGQAHQIALHIASVIDKFKPDTIAIEGLAFGMKGNVTRDLGGLQFVIVAHLQEVKKQHVEIIAPLTVKKYATDNGRAKKEDMINSLPQIVLNEFTDMGLKKTTGLSDLADAYWIAKVAENKHNKKV